MSEYLDNIFKFVRKCIPGLKFSDFTFIEKSNNKYLNNKYALLPLDEKIFPYKQMDIHLTYFTRFFYSIIIRTDGYYDLIKTLQTKRIHPGLDFWCNQTRKFEPVIELLYDFDPVSCEEFVKDFFLIETDLTNLRKRSEDYPKPDYCKHAIELMTSYINNEE